MNSQCKYVGEYDLQVNDNALEVKCQLKNNRKIYVGLDIGTDSVGYAVTNQDYDLQKFHGQDAWGSVLFDQASLSDERRGFRSARRRLDRRQQRVILLQEIFAKEIAKVDPRFFIRLSESYKWREDTEDRYVFFNDEEYTDSDYMREYPTIHHLICDLMNNENKHDIRHVYLACSWLVAHRGHFLNNLDVDKLDRITDIKSVYEEFLNYFRESGYEMPWNEIDIQKFGDVLKRKIGITAKNKELISLLLGSSKPSKVTREVFPFSQEGIIKLLAGGQYKVKDLFGKEEYEDLASISLGMEEEKFAELGANIGEDFELISVLRSLYDWSILADILDDDSNSSTISAAKVAVYEQHKKDLKTLKYFMRKYAPKKYNEVFRDARADNYVAYSYHIDSNIADKIKKKAGIEEFSKYIGKIIGNIVPEQQDQEAFDDMSSRIGARVFLPKQKNTDNRVIPRQLYEYELVKILDNASAYFEFLNEIDENNITNKEKVISIFRFRIPYYVGPLNQYSEHAWIVRKAGKILPWNFSEMVDDDSSESEFIKRMTNQCTYLSGEPVLPKDSLCYQKFMVLNEINNIKINGQKIPVEAKQGIYKALFENKKKVSRKDIENYLVSNGYLNKDAIDSLSGIDISIKSNLNSYISFKNLLTKGILSESDVEKIIERATYAEDKSRVGKWLRREFPDLSEEDVKYICRIKIKDFGRLSKTFLTGLIGTDKNVGEEITILHSMWETNDNLMELLSDRYTFTEEIEYFRKEYYSDKPLTLEQRLDNMYISNAVRRPIYRTLAIVKDVVKAFGVPEKIFIEVTRGGGEKGKRTKTRQQQILDFYSNCKNEDVKDLKQELESLGEYVDNKLQGDRLFLYFMQFGRCAYSGESIDLQKLMAGSKEYDIDHIYPQAYVKDDSIINNKVLVLSKENGEKKDVYPIKAAIRNRMHSTWEWWNRVGVISDEKYKRLIRSTPFTEDEKYGFINRQLTETSQSTKAVAELLKEKYPDTEIVYSKASITSDFRHEYDLIKSRIYNDLHHAVDAYLNIVVGNVYNMKFSKRWFSIDSSYSIKTKTIFSHEVRCGEDIIWDGGRMLAKVKKTAQKNSAHLVKFATFKTGGLFDQMPVKKASGLVPIKAGLPTEKYGGYNKAGAMFYIPTRYKAGKKNEIIIMSVELMHGKRFLADETFAEEYAFKRLHNILGKQVEEVSFPMGMRPWKVNTMLSLDGFRVCITGIGSGGKCLIAQPVMQFVSDEKWKTYIKAIERFEEKRRSNTNLKYDAEYDVINQSENVQLYDLYIDKLQNTIYQKRINSPLKILIDGREKFGKLSVEDQCQVLLNLHSVFGRMTGGCDLILIGGSGRTGATVSFSSTISNWKKNYQDVRIIDQSPSGLWEKQSENLLELL